MITIFLLLFLQVLFLLIPACSFFVFSFLTNWKISLVAFIGIFRSRHWELFCKTALWQDITKIVIFFSYKIGVFSTVYQIRKFINILKKKSSCAGILLELRSKSPSCSFTEQLLASDLAALQNNNYLLLIIYLINKCDKNIRHLKNQIITHRIIFRRKM